MLAEGIDDNGDLLAFKAGTGGYFAVSGASFLSSATITRPADTTAYEAKDVISTGAGAILTFAGMGRINGGSGLILVSKLTTNQKANAAQHRLHLFNVAPTPIADNSPFAFLDANVANWIGAIDYPAMSTSDPTASTGAFAVRPSPDGNSLPPNLWFKCAAGDTNLYGILLTLSVYTPAAAQGYRVELGGAQD